MLRLKRYSVNFLVLFVTLLYCIRIDSKILLLA